MQPRWCAVFRTIEGCPDLRHIDYAVWMVYDAQLAVLDALDARVYADERAKIAGVRRNTSGRRGSTSSS